MGPSLARMAKRCDPDAACHRRIAMVGLRSSAKRSSHRGRDGDPPTCSTRASLAALPDAPNVVFMAGQKFGTTGSPATTWAMNAAVPALVRERYAGARTVVFSTGNVYPLTPATRGGSRGDGLTRARWRVRVLLPRSRAHLRAAARAARLADRPSCGSTTRTTCATACSPTSRARIMHGDAGRPGAWATSTSSGRATRTRCARVRWRARRRRSRTSSTSPAARRSASRDLARATSASARRSRRVFTGEEAPDALLSNASRMSDAPSPIALLPPEHTDATGWRTGCAPAGRLLGKPTIRAA